VCFEGVAGPQKIRCKGIISGGGQPDTKTSDALGGDPINNTNSRATGEGEKRARNPQVERGTEKKIGNSNKKGGSKGINGDRKLKKKEGGKRI